MGEIKGLVLVISGINGKYSPKKVFIWGCVCVCVGVGLQLYRNEGVFWQSWLLLLPAKLQLLSATQTRNVHN